MGMIDLINPRWESATRTHAAASAAAAQVAAAQLMQTTQQPPQGQNILGNGGTSLIDQPQQRSSQLSRSN
jgi:hypothetical protein